MSLYLKSLEAESPALVRTQMRFGHALLPSLRDNIRVGNSLVSTDFYAQSAMNTLDDYEEHRLRPFKWESETEGFGTVLEAGGFDAVIGNPPYFSVDGTYGVGHAVPAYLQGAYPAVWDRMTDIYYYFLAKAAELSRKRVGFIVSRAFLEARYAEGLRQTLSETSTLQQLIDFNAFFVFADADIATAIVALNVEEPHGDTAVHVRKLDTAAHGTPEVIHGLRNESPPFGIFDHAVELDSEPWHFPTAREAQLFALLDEAGARLESLCELGQGMQTGANRVFASFSDDEVGQWGFPEQLVKRRARNSDIQAFYIRPEGPWALYLEDVERYDDLPDSVRNYLESPGVREALERRAAFRRGNCEWWRWTWPLHKDLHDEPRIVNPYRTGNNRFAIDWDFRFFTSTDTTVAFLRDDIEEDIRYIVGLLNSRVLTCRFRGMGKLTSPNMWEAFDNSIARLPVRRIDFSSTPERSLHEQLVDLVTRLEGAIGSEQDAVSANDRSIAARRAEGLRDELDSLVLDLYGISDPSDRRDILAFGAPL